MKKRVTLIICVLGILALSSCRSTSQSCGLAENSKEVTQVKFENSIL